ncbi:hypothetical protein BMH32_07775 [Leucobacter sp. OLJS4]|uniref:GNAT family N-acetyltransferase n=1 Tax=unclassified Leucobacter TaxID=2621730 RepID=UPI000C17B396|nr:MULTISPECIES: GNAT family N-acetyltransferase [unclassified Leucobacter]PII82339.1 hypothetical protein BMH25_10680 [Leucobacter sp. OLCALW19]PII87479.1 hypothetical protein BMH26_10125 [Leucobacter sp. OLTLW20]PII94463.1 hypothetical protein BMH27_00275 [Leucobacter sp. OLAS13]PIJ00737.1 hypothetical protein BMH29_01240 [Leucobacter sp. OLDS2]PIJ03371.1 hypothetical protein BMH31_07820 [Leucobacter sp. OLIS6]
MSELHDPRSPAIALPQGLALRSARFAELDASALYAIARLRSEVFVVEQDCPYLDLDGRDLEPGAEQFWVEAADAAPEARVAATLRVLQDSDAARIGRVATAPAWRGRSLAAALMRAAIDAHDVASPERPMVLDAQSYLTGWYARFGFVQHGEEFVEDGIPHTPMRREPRAAA